MSKEGNNGKEGRRTQERKSEKKVDRMIRRREVSENFWLLDGVLGELGFHTVFILFTAPWPALECFSSILVIALSDSYN